jgi:type II secretory pathway component GspD/PulD (secretin)
MEDRKNTVINKVPILGDIPLLGQLFRRTELDKTKTELLIFLTPHVAQQPEALKAMSREEMNHTRLTPNAVEPGTFQEHFNGMQRGQTPQTQPAASSTIEFAPVDAPSTQPTGTTAMEPIHIPAR